MARLDGLILITTFAVAYVERTILQALVIVILECVPAVPAALLIALFSRKTVDGDGHSRSVNPLIRSLILGLALGPVGGVLAGTLALMSLRGGAPGPAHFWTSMLGVERMFGLAGGVAGAVFWLMVEKRYIALSEESA